MNDRHHHQISIRQFARYLFPAHDALLSFLFDVDLQLATESESHKRGFCFSRRYSTRNSYVVPAPVEGINHGHQLLGEITIQYIAAPAWSAPSFSFDQYFQRDCLCSCASSARRGRETTITEKSGVN